LGEDVQQINKGGGREGKRCPFGGCWDGDWRGAKKTLHGPVRFKLTEQMRNGGGKKMSKRSWGGD